MIKRKKRGRKPRMPNKAEFEFRYYSCNLTGEEMAELYGVTKGTIYNWATQYRREEEST